MTVSKLIQRIRERESIEIPVIADVEDIKSTLTAIYEKLAEISYKIDIGFPNSSNWKWRPIVKKGETIQPGRRLTLYDQKGNGYIYYFIISVSNPDAKLMLDVGADDKIELNLSARDLRNMGFEGSAQGHFQVTKWDETNNIYVVGYAPIGLGVPFKGRNRAEIINSTSLPCVIYGMWAWLIMTEE